jgi:hypothetical protein
MPNEPLVYLCDTCQMAINLELKGPELPFDIAQPLPGDMHALHDAVHQLCPAAQLRFARQTIREIKMLTELEGLDGRGLRLAIDTKAMKFLANTPPGH